MPPAPSAVFVGAAEVVTEFKARRPTPSPEPENLTCIESNRFVVPTQTLHIAELPRSVDLMNFATKLFVPALASGADVSDDEDAFFVPALVSGGGVSDDWPRAGAAETARTQTDKMDTRAMSTRTEFS